MTAYLRPTAPIAADVLLPTDPGLAMALAQRLMVKPLMANHHHGLWGYSGRTAHGHELTVQASGIGAPSTAAVVGELVAHGARRVIRVGRATALEPGRSGSEAVVVTGALGADGTSTALGTDPTHQPDGALTEALRAAAGHASPQGIVSFDLGINAAEPLKRSWIAEGRRVVDLETAALFALAARRGLAAAAALVVTPPAPSMPDEAVEADLLDLGAAAGRALALGAAVAQVR